MSVRAKNMVENGWKMKNIFFLRHRTSKHKSSLYFQKTIRVPYSGLSRFLFRKSYNKYILPAPFPEKEETNVVLWCAKHDDVISARRRNVFHVPNEITKYKLIYEIERDHTDYAVCTVIAACFGARAGRYGLRIPLRAE